MLLFSILILLVLTAILVLILNRTGQNKLQTFLLRIVVFCFFLSTALWVYFDRGCINYQFVMKNNFYNISNLGNFMNQVSFAVDGISLFFVVLSTFLIPLCILTIFKINFKKAKEFCFYFLILEIFLILSFTSTDIISFFIYFESILIPMFLIIGIWGSRQRRVLASFYFFIYTMLGSVFLFFVFLLLYYDIGVLSFYILNTVSIDLKKQIFLWFFVYIAFSIKIPTIPLHLWLCEAHVESPTAGSVILAGLLLKLGGYGFLRILVSIFSQGTVYFLPFTDTFALISIVYASFTTIRQIDMKRIIAYSSISHMNLVVLGIFSGNIQGISGSIFLMLAHGIVSSALFFLIGVLYDKYYTRIIFYYGGLVRTMPIFSVYLLFFCMANVGLPGTCNFIGELVIFIGLIERNFITCIFSVTGVILSVVYTMYFFNRLVFGNLNLSYIFIYQDVIVREFFTLKLCMLLTLILGIFPNLVFDTILTSVTICIKDLI